MHCFWKEPWPFKQTSAARVDISSLNSSSFSTFNHHPDILNDNKIAFKPFAGVESTLFDMKNSKNNYTLDEEREDELNNSGPASLATSLPCLNNAILTSNGNHGKHGETIAKPNQ